MSKMFEVAKEASLEAAEILVKHFDKSHKIKSKDVSDNIVTEVDIKSDTKILQILHKHFPDHGFFTEESGKKDINKKYVWVIDPLDGTSAYAEGLPTFGVSIGLLKNGKPILGVINLPMLNKFLWAEKRRGAYLNNRKINVNKINSIDKAFIGLDIARISRRKEIFDKVQLPIIYSAYYTPILGSVICGLAYVAQGVYSAYVNRAYPWDFAAGSVIVEEAGGKVTDFWGKPVDWFSNRAHVIASNGLVHDEIVSLIKL